MLSVTYMPFMLKCRSAITRTQKSNLKLQFAAPINYARKIFIKSTTGFSLNLQRIDLKRRDRARLCMPFQAWPKLESRELLLKGKAKYS